MTLPATDPSTTPDLVHPAGVSDRFSPLLHNLALIYAAVCELVLDDDELIATGTCGSDGPSVHLQARAFERCRASIASIEVNATPSGRFHANGRFGGVTVVTIFDAPPSWMTGRRQEPDPALVAKAESAMRAGGL